MKTKVAHIITKLEMGGAQGNTIYTTAHLNRIIFEPELICGEGGILDEKIKSEPGSRSIFLKNLKREISPLADILALAELFNLLKKEKPDIVHTHSSKAGILGRIAAALARVKIIVHTFHGFGFNDRQNFLTRNFYILLEKFCASFTDRLVFVSIENMKEAEKRGIASPAKSILIRSGIKIAEYGPGDKSVLKEFAFPENSRIIVTLGNLKPQKNPDDFYDIACRLLKSRKDCAFLYLGGGERLKEFKTRAENDGLAPRLNFAGWREDSAALLGACDFFLLTSLWEGLPRSLLEAMLCGLVPLCYKTDGVADVIKHGENGLLFDRGEKGKAAEALSGLLDDFSLYSKLKEGVLKTDFSEFDIDLMVKKQEKLYLELARIKILRTPLRPGISPEISKESTEMLK